MKKLFAIIIFLLPTIVIADDYVYRNGYYYYGNEPQAYYRSLITTPGYWSYGRYYPGYSYYKYYPYTPATSYADPVDWRSKTLEIAKLQVQYKAKFEQEILEQKNYLEAIRALGLQNTIPYNGTIPSYVDGHYYSHQVYGANASTQYGNTYNSYAQANNNNLLEQLYQMASQHTINSQALLDKSQTGFQQLVNTEGLNRAKVAEIIAKGQMVSSILKSLENGPSTITQGYSFKVTPQSIVTDSTNVNQATKEQLAKQFQGLVNAKCIMCHSAAEKKGGFDINTYMAMTPDQKQVVFERLTTQDPSKLMPRDKNGQGVRLTPEELRLFVLN